MQVVVEIDDNLYTRLFDNGIDNYDDAEDMAKAIRNGTPLPKGHGRLCDLDAALKCVDDDSVKDCDAKWQAIGLFEWAMAKRVVIEADNAESEG